MADDDQVLPAHFSSFDTSLPASFSNMGEDTVQRPEDQQIGQGLSGIPSAPATWADVGHHAMASVHEGLATGAGFMAATARDPELEASWRRSVREQQLSAEESRAAATPTAQPGWGHPLLWAAEQAPNLAAMAVPAAIGAAVAGPVGGAAVLGAIMGAQTEGDIYNRLTQEGIEPTLQQKTGAFALGAATGVATEPVGALVGKVAVSPLVRWGLGIAGDATVFGASSGATEYTAQQDEIAASKRPDIDQSAILGATVSGAEMGAGFGAGFGLFRGHPEGTQTGGKATIKRTKTDGYQKPEAKTPSPPTAIDASNTGPAPPSSPVGPAEAAALTPRVEPPTKPVLPPTGVVQPTGETAQEPQGATPAGQQPSAGPPPPPPPGPQPATAPAPPEGLFEGPTPVLRKGVPIAEGQPVPESEATLREQFAALTDTKNPREAMVYPQGVQPFEPTTLKGRYWTARLKKDGRIVQYDRYGPHKLSLAKIAEAEKTNKLNEILQLGPVPQTEAVQQSVAGAGEPAVVTERAPPSVPGEPGLERKAAEGTTATAPVQAEALEAVKTPGSTVQVETHQETIGDRFKRAREEAVARQQAEAAPIGAATPESRPDPLAGMTKLFENKFGMKLWQDGDGNYYRQRGDEAPTQIDEKLASIIQHGMPKEAPKATTTTSAEAPAQPRVLRADTEEERAAAERQRAADAAAAERVKTETAAATEAEAKAAAPPKEIKGMKKGPKDVEHMQRVNAIADEVVGKHPQLSEEEKLAAINPTREGGKGARIKALAYVKDLLAKAKEAGFEFKERAMHRTAEALQHSNAAMILYEAKLLDGAKPKDKDFGRFFHNEHRLRTEEGRQAYKDILELRKETGKEVAKERGKPTGEAQAVEDIEKAGVPEAGSIEKPDVAEEMEAATERIAEEAIAKKPGEERKLTENERRAQEASERARAKLAEREVPRERPTPESKEGEKEEEPDVRGFQPRTATGFQVAGRSGRVMDEAARKAAIEKLKAKREKPSGLSEQRLRAGEEYGEEPFAAEHGNTIDVTIRGDTIPLYVSRTETAAEAISKGATDYRYIAGVPKMMPRLREMVVKIAGDTPVHYISGEEMAILTGHDDTLGAYHSTAFGGRPGIVINADRARGDTALHEAFHAATDIAISKSPELRALMERLRVEVLKNLPDLNKEERDYISYFLTKDKEFLTGMMTNWRMQELLKGVKISEQLAKDIGIPKWRKMTSWNGILHIIQKALGLEPRDVSAVEAAMSLSEQLMWRDPRNVGDLMVAAGRLAEHQMGREGWSEQRAPERDQEAVIRSLPESLARVKDIDKVMVKQFTKDKLTNLGGNVMKGSAKILSGTWLDDAHGHLFKDAKGAILQAINDARNKVSHDYNQRMRDDIDHINRGYMLDKIHASQMADYSKLMNMSVLYNIRADQPAPKPSKAGKHVQRDAFDPEARAIFDRLHADLKRRYTDDIKYYRDSQAEQAQSVLDNTLPLFDPPKGSTLEEVMDRARKNDLTDDDWAHYEDLGVAGPLREASRLASRQAVYANTQRDGRWAVTGRYEMPKGGKDTSYSGSKLSDNVREFDTQDQARAYMAGTRMKATAREAYYVKDQATGKYTDVYPSTPETEKAGIVGRRVRSADAEETRHRVSLERQNYQLADSPAEAQRNREAMEADGVKELSGVMDKRDEKSWSDLNSADQNLLERKIDARGDLTPAERQHMKDVTRQMMLSSRGGMSSHMIQARKVAGAKFDSAAGLHAYARAANFHIARQAHSAELSDAMSRMDAHEKAMRATDSDNATRRSIVANEYRNRVFKNPDTLASNVSPFFHKIMTWAFLNFLARPSHIILSQLHPYIYSVPMVAAKHGYWKALQGQHQAMKDLGGMGHNLWEGTKAGYEVYKSGHEQNIDKAVAMARGVDPILRMINGLKDKGERDALMKMWETEHLHSAFDASVFAGSGMDRTNAIVRQFTDAMEANNRLSTALNAYRLEKAMHKDHANALAYSRRVIEQTHGLFSSTNTASVFKNPIMRAVMQFRQQPMNLAIMMYRNMAKALPEKLGGHGDNEARWTLAYQLGTAALLGGMGGMPMDLPKLVGLAGQALGGPSPADWDDKFYRALVSYVGETAAKAIHDGLPGIMGPYGPSLGHRTGFDAGFVFSEPKSDSADDLFGYAAKSLAGASVGMGMDWLTALHQAQQGDWERAGESFLPGSLKDFLKAYRNATQGVTAGKQQIAPGSVGDELLQILGFSGIERERQMAGHFALKKELSAQQATARETVQAKLKAAQQARRDQGKSVLGVKVSKKYQKTAREYQHAYQ